MAYIPKSAIPEEEYKPKSATLAGNSIINTLVGAIPTATGITAGIATSPLRALGLPGRALNAAGTGVGTAMGENLKTYGTVLAGTNPELSMSDTWFTKPKEMAEQYYVNPAKKGLEAAAITFGTGEVLNAAGKLLEPITKPLKNVSKNLLRSLTTVPRQVAKDMRLDSAITELSKHGIADNVDDMAVKADGVIDIVSKSVNQAAAGADDQINLDMGIKAARNIAEVNKGRFIRSPDLKDKAIENIREILSPQEKDIVGKSGVEVALEAERKLQDIAASYRSAAYGGLDRKSVV